MKVKELKEILERFDDDLAVLCVASGYDFSSFSGEITKVFYVEECHTLGVVDRYLIFEHDEEE